MAAEIGSLRVRLGMDAGEFDRAAKRAAGRAEQFGSSIRRALNFAAVGLAVQQLTSHTNKAVERLDAVAKQARLAGTSAEEFQKLAFAARTVGIENEKLSDIFKDTRDRVGDFLQTGGGPLVDFFDNIAPKIGITAEQLRHMSGPQILGTVAKAMEDAGLSANEMVFHFEAIAGDAAKLLPLYKDNARALNDLGRQAEKTGAIISNRMVAQSEQMAAKMKIASSVIDAQLTKAFLELAPALTIAARGIARVATEIGKAVGAARQLVLMNSESVKVFKELHESEIKLRKLPETLQKMADAGAQNTREYQRLLVLASELPGRIVRLRKEAVAFREEAAKAFGIPLEPPPEKDKGTQGGGTNKRLEEERKALADKLAIVEQGLLDETELIQTEYDKRLEMIAAAEAAGLETAMSFDELRLRSWRQMNEKMNEIADRQAALERLRQQQQVQGWMTAAGNVVQAMETLFGESKATAIASTIINTSQAIMNALAHIPPPAGYAVAASIGALGAAQVAKIASTTRKSGGGGGTAPAAPPPVNTQAQPAAAQQAVLINVTGDTFTREHFIRLVDGLNAVQGDGPRLVVAGG